MIIKKYQLLCNGNGSHGTSIRVGNETYKKGYGYFEDRRPDSYWTLMLPHH